jgi:hypothetical protein
VTEIGARLFDSAFGGEVGTLFARSLDAATNAARPLRLQLQFDEAAELAELPWEYLYSRALDRFIVLSSRTPLVRYLPLAQPAPSLRVTPPLRLLVVIATPADLPHLQAEAEWSHLNQALSALVQEGSIVIERLAGATLAALRERLAQRLGEPGVNILHFIGHGDFAAPNSGGQSSGQSTDQGFLFFEDAEGQHDAVSAVQLATLLHDHTTLRLLFLNACYGATSQGKSGFAGVAQKVVQQGVPSVLAMQFAVSDAAAIALARDFYASLAAGMAVECALSEARKGIFSEGQDAGVENFEWGTPLLFSRSPDGFLFAIEKEGEMEKKDAMNQSGASDSAQSSARSATPAPWWQEIGPIQASGDVIIATIGDNAHNVAVGKQITQQIYELVGPPTPSDKEVITQKLQQVQAALASAAASNPAATSANLKMAEGYLQLLGGELSKTEASETPSANTITLVGNWLLDNVPELLEALTSLFATPAVGRVIGKAGEAAVAWVKTRFGDHLQ